ncbi:glucose-1-phosphate cytidylyltransferase [Chitinispirillales bacterium ANBcel5]|uniref:glucose-1-phosphate cytidylyltransferase n=1 Tax=Cellulosispirillum alkaliphilum TaxID=3039283 RepID=UPI002A55D565|nr:glucose-1-phosphate cytidylyltransferase [Chitinispirillales bacterium ANBcel5]
MITVSIKVSKMEQLSNLQAVILCGGQGTRIRSVTEKRPKPLIDIGGKPILWHIMKTYSFYGVRSFVLCLGYKGEMIVDYFENYHSRNHDFTMKINDKEQKKFHYNGCKCEDSDVDDWEITFAHTGEETMTGGRLKRIEKHIDTDRFFCTYGDGLSDLDLRELYSTHIQSGKTATLTGVHLPTTFGVVETTEDGTVTSFREKPSLAGVINGGYFVFEKEIFDYIEGDATVLEDRPFRILVRDSKIGMFKHEGFWHCMDTYKDYESLNTMWKKRKAPWRIW